MKIKLFIQFARYLKPYLVKELILLILMILASTGSLASPFILKIIIDTVFPTHNYPLLIQVLLILLGINILRLGINYFSDYLFVWIGNHVTRDIRMDMFGRMMKLPISFFNKNKAGDLVHRINSEVNSIQNILTGTLVRLINSSCSIIGLIVMLSILNWRLFLLSMIVMPFIFINTRWFQPKIQKNVKKSREKDSDILSFLMERFSNIKLIKSYVRQEYENNKLLDKVEEQNRLNIRNVQLTATTRNITMFFTMLVPVLIFGIGGKQVMAGTMTIGSLVAFIQYMNRIFDPLRDLMGFYFDAIRASVSMQRIFDLVEIKPEDTKGEKDISVQKDITFRKVHFSYDQLKVLQDFSFTFHYGKKYALVGGSGCGKSTLTSLLCRFYEPQLGTVYIGDTQLNKINIDSLRRKIALITQDNQLFHESIAENIRYGKLDSTKKEIEKAAIQVDIASHINQLPDEFDTIIGDQGAGLSGGQQQRIAIARAIIKDADIIILDEATSALDSDSEKNILKYLCDLYKEKMIIIISHRLSAIRDMEQIICMDKGQMTENGTHEELIGRKGFYWRLFKEQIE